jgi:hypothetical protein
MEKRGDEAISFIEKNKDLLKDCINYSPLNEKYIEMAESLLALLEYNFDENNGSFSQGGEKISQSYYQKYSVKKGNNIIQMMAYNRIADGVRRFDFSKYTNDELKCHTEKLRQRAQAGENKMKLAPRHLHWSARRASAFSVTVIIRFSMWARR